MSCMLLPKLLRCLQHVQTLLRIQLGEYNTVLQLSSDNCSRIIAVIEQLSTDFECGEICEFVASP